MTRAAGTSISILIPTLNGGATLPEFFAALALQDIQVDEILVADSASDDDTVTICKNNGAEVFGISRDQFDHGGTRTILASRAKGSILVYFTQDAILSTPDSLRNLVQPLIEKEELCCVYGRQLPLADASLIAAHLRSFNYPGESATRNYADRSKYGLKTVFVSNSFAAYKKEMLATVGFFKNGLIFGEDTCTLGRLMIAGHNVYYASEAAVYHSHNYDYGQEFKRSFDIGVLHSSEKWLLDTYGHAEGVGRDYVQSAFNEIISQKRYPLICDWVMRNAIKYAGYKLGRTYNRLPRKLCSYLSLNRCWWGC